MRSCSSTRRPAASIPSTGRGASTPGRSRPVPVWRLSPRPLGEGVLLVQRWLGWIWLPLTLGCALVGCRLVWMLGYWPRRASEDEGETAAYDLPRTRLAPSLLALALFVALAVVHTWPLASARRPAVAQRQRRHRAQRVGDGVGRPSGPPTSTSPVRRQHLLSRAPHAGVFRGAPRPERAGRAGSMARRLAGRRVQPRPDRGLRADGLDDVSRRDDVDRAVGGGHRGRRDRRVQRAHADAAAAHPGAARRIPAAGAARARRAARSPALEIRRPAGPVDGPSGVRVDVPARLHDGRARRRRAGAAGRLARRSVPARRAEAARRGGRSAG